MNKKILLLLPVLGLLLTGCQKGNEPSNTVNPGSDSGQPVSGVTGVELDNQTLSLQVGQTAKLQASVKPISLDDREVSWSSDHPDIANVDASGTVSALKAGSAKIKATAHADSTKFAECTVTVTARMVTIPKLTVAEILADTAGLKFGANQKELKSYYFFKGSVNSDTRGETSKSWAEGVNVKLENATTAGKYLVSFTKDNAKKYFEMDDVHHFAIVDTPTAGREWDWNETYSTVQRTISGQASASNNGTFLPGTYGSYDTISGCNINQAANDYFFQFVYQTEPVEPTAITVKAAADKVYQGGTLQFEAELAPLAAEGNIVWTATGDEKVTIDKNGLLTAGADATVGATITVKAAYEKNAEINGTTTITVAELINYGTQQSPLTIAEAKAVLDKTGADNSAQPLFVKGVVSESSYSTKYSNYTIWLQSDDGAVAKAFEVYSADLDASITGDYTANNALVGKEIVATGYGKIFTSGSDSTYELTNVTISGTKIYPKVLSVANAPEVAPIAIALDKTTANVIQGGELQLKATLTPINAAGTIAWSSSNVALATVDQTGKVTVPADATPEETVTITAAVGELSATCVITVKDSSAGGGQTETTATLDYAALLAGGITTTAGAQTFSKDGLTITMTRGTANATNSDVRVYANESITFAAGNITKIVFTCSSGNTVANFNDATGLDKTASTWSGSAASVTFSATAQVRMTKLVITYTPAA